MAFITAAFSSKPEGDNNDKNSGKFGEIEEILVEDEEIEDWSTQ